MSAELEANAVYLITGPMAAGKSTVARLLAARFERGVHLEGDLFRRSIVSGRVELTPQPSTEALEQLRLRYRLAAAAADGYHAAGFSVALEDVAAGALLAEYRMLIRSRPCHVIVLLPSPQVVAAREAGREHKGYTAWTVEELYALFAKTRPRVGLWLDTSEQTAEQTVEEILARAPPLRRFVVISDYDRRWPTLFHELAESVQRALADVALAVEHVGSTAVPGLAAKPVIDIDVVLGSAEDVPLAIERLRGLGYLYQGDKGIPGREAFMWPPGAKRHHLYVVVAGSKPHLNHVCFRDQLRGDPQLARQYGELKRSLAERYSNDPEDYGAAKATFISQVLATAER